MKRLLRFVSILVFAGGVMALTGCSNSSVGASGNSVAASDNGSQSTTMPSDQQPTAGADNGYIGNGSYGEAPP